MNLLPVLIVLAQVDSPDDEPTSEAEAPPQIVIVNEDRPAVPQPPKPSPPVSLRFDGGYAPRHLFSLPATGADFGFGVMAQPLENGAFGGSLRGFVGSTENGLHLWDVRAMGNAEVIVVDRIHLGGGVGGFLLGVKRAARDETIRSWGAVGEINARLDILRDDYAIFVRGALSGGFEVYDSSIVWGPTIGAGFELDVAGKRKK